MEAGMILQSLKELAEREGLTEDLDYEPKQVAWVISLAQTGRYLGITSTAMPQGSKGKLLSKTMRIPRRAGRTSANLADFLIDKPEYVLGIAADQDLPDKRKAKLEPRRLLFLAGIEAAAQATDNAALQAVAAFLKSDAGRTLCAEDLTRQSFASNDLIAFEVAGRLVHEDTQVRLHFAGNREASGETSAQCLVCGRARPAIEKHPSVQVRGGSSSGIALVSFNSAAFESYSWDRNANAPVCRNCAEAYTTGLRRLLSNRYPDPKRPGENCSLRSIGLTNDTVAVFWADTANDSVDLFAAIFENPDPPAVHTLLESPWKGLGALRLSTRFYCLLISGGQGRATLRGIHSALLADVEANVREYFACIAPYSAMPLPLYVLLRSLAVQRKPENLPPGLAGEAFLAILFGTHYPRTLLSFAVQRCRAEQAVPRERAAVLNLFLYRNLKHKELNMGLNRESPKAGYRLGRLLAVLERMQTQANQGLNKTIVDRYYGAASTRPGTVFPSLIRLAPHHIAKLKNPVFLQRDLGEVLDGLDSFPAHLSLEDQGLFALGYYHQRQDYFKKRDGAATAESTEGDQNHE
jgi:CRISPR-associated protein Csd1